MNHMYPYDAYTYDPYYAAAPLEWAATEPQLAGSYQACNTCYGYSYYIPQLAHKPPISALAIHNSDALFVTGHCVRESSRSKAAGLSSSFSSMAVHSFPEGNLYSACAAHVEAPLPILNALALSLFGNNSSTNNINQRLQSQSSNIRIPPAHAYQPCYSFGEYTGAATSTFVPSSTHLGINTILPFSSNTFLGNNNVPHQEHFVCTISPSSVRLHTIGGLQISSSSLRGMISGTLNPIPTYTQAWDCSMATHVTVGGIYINPEESSSISSSTAGPHLNCLDLYSQGLRIVSSCTLRQYEDESKTKKASTAICVTKLTTLHDRNTIVGGCSDGTVRILDGGWRSKNIETAKMKAHTGGVTDVSVQGNLICTCGYTSRGGIISSLPSATGINTVQNGNSYFAFPDPNIYIFDIRFLGRGGVRHPFRGYKAGPRFLSFIDGDPEDDHNTRFGGDGRILVASGQSGGAIEIITPFKNLQEDYQYSRKDDVANFLQPEYESTSEAITCIATQGINLALGTSLGNVLQYKRLSTKSDIPSVKSRLCLSIPPLIPEPPILSIDPYLLLKDYEDKDEHRDVNIQLQYPPLRCRSIFNTYITDKDQLQLSRVGYDSYDMMSQYYSLGPLSERPFVIQGSNVLSKKLQQLHSQHISNGNDFLCSIPMSQAGIEAFPMNITDFSNKKESILNPNRFRYGHQFKKYFYHDADPREGKHGRNSYKSKESSHRVKEENDEEIPQRYKIKNAFRPSQLISSNQDYASVNKSLFPGWDYAPFRPNAFFPSVLCLLFFTPEIRHACESFQHELLHGEANNNNLQKAPLLAEMGFLFHQIASISSYAHSYPTFPSGVRPVLSPFVPTNFLSTLSILSEVSALALLDSSPAAVELARRPEAFYRFLIHHLDKELPPLSDKLVTYPVSTRTSNDGKSTIDNLQGIDLITVSATTQESALSSGRSLLSTTTRKKSDDALPKIAQVRSLFVELAYDPLTQSRDRVGPEFGEILAYSLCKVVKLRAWSNPSKCFETISQGKAITSLPKLLCLTCACSGFANNDGLEIWRKSTVQDPWLPEIIDLEIFGFGNIRVRQFFNNELWRDFGSNLSSFDTKLARMLTNVNEPTQSPAIRKRYRLDAVLSFVRDESEMEFGGVCGHHVLHVRVSDDYRRMALTKQLEKSRQTSLITYDDDSISFFRSLGVITQDEWIRRENFIQRQLMDSETDEWLLFNGIMVSSTSAIDARSFNNEFKEPCILYFREIPSEESSANPSAPSCDEYHDGSNDQLKHIDSSISPIWCFHQCEGLPGPNDMIAFDAEFVQVQQELSAHTASGQKRLIHEGRNALARISLVDCRSGQVLCDEYVIPLETVTDYLTRFSGIRPGDLNPQTSSFPLISQRTAYLKIRTLVERGCIFVGHGLNQDFTTINVFVPPAQIIDTLLIYHLENRRYISLRFLVNFFFERDMQQETHDSVEDSKAAWELYQLAVTMTEQGIFKQKLLALYDYGERVDWKIGLLGR